STEPRTVSLLLLRKKTLRPLYGRMISAETHGSKRLDSTTGDVAGRRIDHRIVIREGNLGQKLFIAIPIEGGPSAIPVLHSQNPGQCPLHGLAFGLLTLSVAKFDFTQRCKHLKRVVYIGIELVRVLEVPTAGLAFGILYLPIANFFYLFIEKPFGRL